MPGLTQRAAISTNEWLIGDDKTLSPQKYFIVIPALFGNGESTSPSNTPPERTPRPFPTVTFYDNVRAQHQLVTQHLGIRHARAVVSLHFSREASSISDALAD